MPLNANALLTVQQVRDFIKLDGTTDTSVIEFIINGVSSAIENFCHSKFIDVAVVETLDGPGLNKIIVEFCPIKSLTSVKFDSVAQTLTDFKFNGRSGIVYFQYGVFAEGFQNIEIAYISGYGANMAAMPADVILAALKQSEQYYKRFVSDFSQTFDEGVVNRIMSSNEDFQITVPESIKLLSYYRRNSSV